MWSYEPPLRDMLFVLDEFLCVRADWEEIPEFAALDAGSVSQILDEAAGFAVDTLAPINSSGDLEACRYADGQVTVPSGYAAAYRRYCEAGWPSLACDAADGGQGLPQLLNAALYEMLNAANHAWTMYPALAHGAYECLRAHAPESLKAQYLPKIVSGEWMTTMCLTEPQAGSDVGLLRTRAEPQSDGSYRVSGSKIFISGGEHDMTENIVHLVLARLPDAPHGTRGISLFLVPKRVAEGGSLRANAVRCDGVERKMGLKGSATCVMNFDRAQGWLVGDLNRGLNAMFVMMNAARVHVGLQGLGHAEAAYQNARRYAGERRQMRAVRASARADARVPGGTPAPSDPGVAADPIIEHPAIQRILMSLRAVVEAERALAYWATHLLDLAAHHPDRARRDRAGDLAAVLTPIIKSLLTENGFTLSSAALQIWGGYGYIHDYRIEQTVRDSRISMIYEGTNEIQAIDLLVRKVIADHGAKFRLLVSSIREEANLCAATPRLARHAAVLDVLCAELERITTAVIAESAAAPDLAQRVATDFLRLVGLTLLGGVSARAARIAGPRVDADDFYRAKLATADFFFDYVLPETKLRVALIDQGRRANPWFEQPSPN